MKTIIKIAWRNLWRNKLRTSVILASIILGLWGSMFFMAMVNGMNENRISSAINLYLRHIYLFSAQGHPNIKKMYLTKCNLRQRIFLNTNHCGLPMAYEGFT